MRSNTTHTTLSLLIAILAGILGWRLTHDVAAVFVFFLAGFSLSYFFIAIIALFFSSPDDQY